MNRRYLNPGAKFYKEKAAKVIKKKKSSAKLKNDLQKIFNKYIRLRDMLYKNGQPYFICISCNKPRDIKQMTAGHFYSVGSSPSLRYNEDNVHGQCVHCNFYLHSNALNYRENLIKKIGLERVELLEIKKNKSLKLLSFELEMLMSEYKQKIKSLEK